MENKKSLTTKYAQFFARNSHILKNTVGIFGSICTVGFFLKTFSQAKNWDQIEDTESAPFEPSYDEIFELNLVNSGQEYIEATPIENLISFPRYKRALSTVKEASRVKSKVNNQRVIDELSRLNSEKNKDQLINDSFIEQIRHLISEDLMLDLALKAPQIDNRIFRIEPPTTIKKIDEAISTDYYGNTDYGLIFEFYNNYASRITKEYKKKSPINTLITRLNADISSLQMSEYFIAERTKLNVWSTDEMNVYDLENETNPSSDFAKLNNLKQKFKQEFIERNEMLILTLVENLAAIDTKAFVEMNGLELLILLYEKHKYEEAYLNAIGNCLCLISLNPENRQLFIQSGWLKRLNQMLNKVDIKIDTEEKNENINLIRELIAHKILFNLNQGLHESNLPSTNHQTPLYYSTMLYPLNPLDSEFIRLSSNMIDYNTELIKQVENHEHVVDVIFVHGLKGSLFKTWCQDMKSSDDIDPAANKQPETELSTIEKSILERINSLIEAVSSQGEHTYCWPKDWLCPDLNIQLDDTKFRLIGVNYESMFSSWQKENFDDKKLRIGIKERAISLAEQLKQAHVGERPIIWVAHSMGGLIVKQILTHMNEIEQKLDKKKMPKKELANILDTSLIKNTKSIVFLSTPHLGAQIATTMANLSFALFPTPEIVQLCHNSSYLVDLNKKFLELIRTKCTDYDILSVCENKSTFYFANLWVRTVTEESADIGVGEFYVAEEKDHLNVCKPVSKDCIIYRKIFDLMTSPCQWDCKNCKLEMKLKEKRNEKYVFQLAGLFANFEN